MPDHLSQAGRSKVMAAIRSKDTRPELAVRAGLRAVGATGYRLHVRSMPGRPDLAFTRWKVAVFVDGAFWHGHPDHFDEAGASPYWKEKMARNRRRDREANAALEKDGWTVVRCWDFEVKSSPGAVIDRIVQALRTAGWSRRQPADEPIPGRPGS
jgi:DNA mismatch endonuclease (patch repair protein)